jgi:alkylation response protein AidB-like acyl-CoA dehydrogenase
VDFALSEEQVMLRDSVRAALAERSALAGRRDRLESPRTFAPELWALACEQGWTSVLVPEELGGAAVSAQPLVDATVLFEELGRVLSSLPLRGAAAAAAALGPLDGDDARGLLAGLAEGTEVLGSALGTEELAAGGSPPAARLVDGRIEGELRFVQDAAELTTVVALVESAGDEVLVGLPMSAPGISVTASRTLDLTRRFDAVRLDGVAVGDVLVLSSGEEARHAARRGRRTDLVLRCAEAVGAADQILGATLDYATHRVQFGRVIASFQALKHRFADLAIELEAMRVATWHAAMTVADDDPDADRSLAAAGAFVPEAFCHLSGECLQLHGGIGFTWEHDCHLFVRRATCERALGGSPEDFREGLVRLLEATHVAAGGA